jgi:hypothetical protein
VEEERRHNTLVPWQDKTSIERKEEGEEKRSATDSSMS